MGVNPDLQSSNGFELIRQLTMEYSLRTRSEALSFRTALAHKSFSLHASETSPKHCCDGHHPEDRHMRMHAMASSWVLLQVQLMQLGCKLQKQT